ncbi:MAG: Ig-like domain-containing protein, partial [Lachnospiraceae bacterium]|nr:Ig-like domain-containing protein [Lachnospiraceae bacterium]
MKSIFKKIAFVLALAMVVTMLPAKAVSAASSDAPDMYKTLLLYLDSGNGKNSDITGTYPSERYASVWGWRENGYSKVEFACADTSVATVSSKGKVTAVKVGTTTVTATFTGDGVSTVTKECKVTVKRNATKAGLSTASAKKVTEEGIAVGDEYQLVAVRKAGTEGNEITVTSDRDQITDGVRFESSNPEIFTVGKTKGKITAVKEGTATLKVWAVQSEGRDTQSGEYQATTQVKEYTVKIVAKDIVAKQSAYNAFVLTFPNPEEAKAALTETKKSLTDANAAVSEAEEIVKVYKVLTDSKDARREVFIGGVAYKDGAEGVTSSIEVTMFSELDEKSKYVICYKDQEMVLETPEYIADGLLLGGWAVETAEDYSVQGIWANLYTANGILLGTGDASCMK